MSSSESIERLDPSEPHRNRRYQRAVAGFVCFAMDGGSVQQRGCNDDQVVGVQ